MTNTPLRTIVVGFGKIASGLEADAKMARYFKYATHAQVLKDHPNFNWVGVVDPENDAQVAARDRWGVAHVGSELAKIIAATDPEVVIITAPPEKRLSIINQCPNLKSAFVEKPLNLIAQEGDELVDTCFKRGINLQVNFWRRGDQIFHELAIDRLAELVGTPKAIFATYGNGLRNNASHMIDFIRMLLGEITAVQANGSVSPLTNSALPGDVQVPFSATLENGSVVSIQPVDFTNYREVGLDIWGSHGRLTIFQEGLSIHHYPVTKNRALEDENEINSDAGMLIESTVSTALYNLYDNLYAATVDNAPLVSSGTSAIRTENIINAVISSAGRSCERVILE
jgi:predicted dehydrogenase